MHVRARVGGRGQLGCVPAQARGQAVTGRASVCASGDVGLARNVQLCCAAVARAALRMTKFLRCGVSFFAAD